MDTVQIVPKDGLPTTIDAFPVAFVCNTHDGDEPGEHWIALCVDAVRHPASDVPTFMRGAVVQ